MVEEKIARRWPFIPFDRRRRPVVKQGSLAKAIIFSLSVYLFVCLYGLRSLRISPVIGFV